MNISSDGKLVSKVWKKVVNITVMSCVVCSDEWDTAGAGHRDVTWPAVLCRSQQVLWSG